MPWVTLRPSTQVDLPLTRLSTLSLWARSYYLLDYTYSLVGHLFSVGLSRCRIIRIILKQANGDQVLWQWPGHSPTFSSRLFSALLCAWALRTCQSHS